jgi:putative redox protein
MMQANLTWLGNMSFESNNHGVKTTMDAPIDSGGQGAAPSPKELILNAMMGCTAMDVVAILKKMRQEIKEFHMAIEVEKTTEHPIHFKSAIITYDLKGDIPAEKVIKAVDSSLTKYCGVHYMISRSCDIKHKIILNGQEI